MSLLMWTLFLKMTYLHNQVWRFRRKDKTNRKFLFCGKAFILLLAHWSRSQTKMSLSFDPCQKYALPLFSWLYPSNDFRKKISNDLNNQKDKSFIHISQSHHYIHSYCIDYIKFKRFCNRCDKMYLFIFSHTFSHFELYWSTVTKQTKAPGKT